MGSSSLSKLLLSSLRQRQQSQEQVIWDSAFNVKFIQVSEVAHEFGDDLGHVPRDYETTVNKDLHFSDATKKVVVPE